MVDIRQIRGPIGPQDPTGKKDKPVGSPEKFQEEMKIQKVREIDPEEQKKRKRREEQEEEEPTPEKGSAPMLQTSSQGKEPSPFEVQPSATKRPVTLGESAAKAIPYSKETSPSEANAAAVPLQSEDDSFTQSLPAAPWVSTPKASPEETQTEQPSPTQTPAPNLPQPSDSEEQFYEPTAYTQQPVTESPEAPQAQPTSQTTQQPSLPAQEESPQKTTSEKKAETPTKTDAKKSIFPPSDKPAGEKLPFLQKGEAKAEHEAPLSKKPEAIPTESIPSTSQELVEKTGEIPAPMLPTQQSQRPQLKQEKQVVPISLEGKEGEISSPIITSHLESESIQKEKEEKHKDEDVSAAAPTPIAPLPSAPIEGPLAPPPAEPAYTRLHPEILDKYERMVGAISSMQTQGKSVTTIYLTDPKFASSVFYGVEIEITEFSTAPFVYNVQLRGSMQAAKVFDENKAKLLNSFQQELAAGNLNFKINTMEIGFFSADKEKELFERKEKASGEKDEQGQRQQQDQQQQGNQ